MRCFRLIPVLFCLLAERQGCAQTADDERSRISVFDATNFKEIFGSLDSDFSGIFGYDAPESEFRVKYNQIFKLEPGNLFGIEGINWHKNQITPFNGLFKIFQVYNQDSAPKPYINEDAGYENEILLDSLNKTGWKLFQALGGIDLLEDSTKTFAGRFMGIFKLCFFYNDKLNLVSTVPKNLALTEASMIFTGYWSPYNQNGLYSPFFWSNLNPVSSPSGSKVLPDLRLNDNGKPNSEVLIELPAIMSIAPAEWWIQAEK